MELRILPDANAVAEDAALFIASLARERVRHGDQFSFAISGGSTPWVMLRQLANLDIPWEGVELFQTDERIAPGGDSRRNQTQIRKNLLNLIDLPEKQIHAMPVEQANLTSAATDYSHLLQDHCGTPPAINLVHLGLGEDGHTASLFTDDPVQKNKNPVAISNKYQGLPRMTLTYPTINGAELRLWIVTGARKRPMLERLYRGDRSIPAGLIERRNAIIMADRAATIGLNL